MSAPMQEVQHAVSELARTVELTNVRVVSFGARLLEPPMAGQQVVAAVDSEVQPAVLPGGFVVEGDFRLTARSAVEGAKDFVELHYRVGAVYRASAAHGPPPVEVLNAFAQSNGMVHLWPYFRAFVQQACAQLAIPAIILQPFRVVTPAQ